MADFPFLIPWPPNSARKGGIVKALPPEAVRSSLDKPAGVLTIRGQDQEELNNVFFGYTVMVVFPF